MLANHLTCNSVLNVASGGTVDGNGNRKYIDICQTETWSSGDGAINGPAVIGSTLPVTLISFNAKWSENKNTVLLSWATASEINNNYFEIQRSVDVINWDVIGKLKGYGNSNILLNYNFVDYYPPYDNTIYYRLKQVDFDGAYEFSKIVTVTKNNSTELLNLEGIFPNPIKKGNKFSLIFNNDIDNIKNIKLYSIHNKAKEVYFTKDSNKIIIETYNLEPGIYIMEISDSITKKIVIY